MRWQLLLAVLAAACLVSSFALEQETVSDVDAVLGNIDTLLTELNSETKLSEARTVRDHLEADVQAENPASDAVKQVLSSHSLDEALQAMHRADKKKNHTKNHTDVHPFPTNGLGGSSHSDSHAQSNSQSAWQNVIDQIRGVAQEHHHKRHHSHHHPSALYKSQYQAAVMHAHAAELAAALKKVAAAKATRDDLAQARTFSHAADQISSLVQRHASHQSSHGAPLESTPIIPRSGSSSHRSSSHHSSHSGSGSRSGSSSHSGSSSESLQALQDKLLALLSKRAFATPEEQEELDVEIRKLVIKVIKAKGGKSPVNHHLDLLFTLIKKVRNSFEGLRALNNSEIDDLSTQVRAFLMLVEKRQGEMLDEKDQAAFCGKRVQEHCKQEHNRCVSACVVKRAIRGNTPIETISCPWSAYQRCASTFDSCTHKQSTVCGVLDDHAKSHSSSSKSGSHKSESSKHKSESSKHKSESSHKSESKKKKSESSQPKGSTPKAELEKLDGMDVKDLKKGAKKDAKACKKKLDSHCAEARLKCQKSCKSQTEEFYEFCDKDRCTRENEQCHKTNDKVCSGHLVIADVVKKLPHGENCEDSEDIECGMHQHLTVTPTIVGSHDSFSKVDDHRHTVSSCNTCSQRRAICQTKCQLSGLNNSPCKRNQCAQEQQSCDRTCKPSVVAMDIALSSLPGHHRVKSNANCPSDAPYCHVTPLTVPKGYLPRRYF
jgi:hypothetical protein